MRVSLGGNIDPELCFILKTLHIKISIVASVLLFYIYCFILS